jgi:hypothetical protein
MSDLSLDSCSMHHTDPNFVNCFVEKGFVIAEKVFDQNLIEEIYNFVSKQYLETRAKFASKFPKKVFPSLGMAKYILSQLQSGVLFEGLIKSNLLLDGLEKLLGPDLALIGGSNLWINDPYDGAIVTNKSLHQEIWGGTDADGVTVWVPFHQTEISNTMSVIPGSHYFGFLPNRNRKIVIPEGFNLPDGLPLAPLKPGCAVFFHSLLLHETAGRGKDIRYASSHFVKNTLAPFTRQQQTFGYIPLRNGPFSKIRSVLGNDFLSPLRTYGGKLSNNEIFHPSDLD